LLLLLLPLPLPLLLLLLMLLFLLLLLCPFLPGGSTSRIDVNAICRACILTWVNAHACNIPTEQANVISHKRQRQLSQSPR
jgi:hypothetical protein